MLVLVGFVKLDYKWTADKLEDFLLAADKFL